LRSQIDHNIIIKIGNTDHLLRGFKFSSGSPKFDFELTSDSIYFKLNLKLNSNEGGFTFLADGKSGKVSADAATVKATYVKGSALEVTFKHGGREAKMTCTLSRNSEGRFQKQLLDQIQGCPV
jgi:hypothetical protein